MTTLASLPHVELGESAFEDGTEASGSVYSYCTGSVSYWTEAIPAGLRRGNVPESLTRTPQWELWLEYRDAFLRPFEKMGPLLNIIARGPGPSVTWQTTQLRDSPNPTQVDTVHIALCKLRETEQALENMKVWMESLRQGHLRSFVEAEIDQIDSSLGEFVDLELFAIAAIKGIRITIRRGTSQALTDDVPTSQQSADPAGDSGTKSEGSAPMDLSG